jgi:hypothetical protein
MYVARLFDDTGHLKTQTMFALLDNAYASLDALRDSNAELAGWTFELNVKDPTPFDMGEYELDRVVFS